MAAPHRSQGMSSPPALTGLAGCDVVVIAGVDSPVLSGVIGLTSDVGRAGSDMLGIIER
jgi:hypothetical protein